MILIAEIALVIWLAMLVVAAIWCYFEMKNAICVDENEKEIMTLTEFCSIHDVDKDELISDSRKGNLVLLRHVFAFTQIKQGKRHDEIASVLNRNRTNVYNSIKKIQGYIDIKDKKVLKLIEKTEMGCDL